MKKGGCSKILVIVAVTLVLAVWWFREENKTHYSMQEGAVSFEDPKDGLEKDSAEGAFIEFKTGSFELVTQGADEDLRETGTAVEAKEYVSRPGPYKLEFEVIEESYAIAFGDIIVGRVDEGSAGGRGYYEPGRPQLWPSHKIPYAIHPELQNPQRIIEAIDYLAEVSPVQLVPFGGEENAIYFIPSGELCASYLGMTGGHQPILVADHCEKGHILHEIMHALGFVHEHSRVERDRHIEILWDNIKEGFFNQFHIVPDSLVHEYRGSVFDFDPSSIMMYSERAFSREPHLKTIRSRTGQHIQPFTDQLSPIDKERLYYLYF